MSAAKENLESSRTATGLWISTILVFIVSLLLVINQGAFLFIDYVNLLIHEGGHGIFRLFGPFVYMLGGTLMQIIIPGMFVFFYVNRGNKIAVQIFLTWLGENLLNISVYASDAKLQRLPLLGGHKVKHDWNYLLSQTGLLEYDYLAGYFFFSLGIACFAGAVIIPLILKKERIVTIDLDLD